MTDAIIARVAQQFAWCVGNAGWELAGRFLLPTA
jgi:hypothetical protein